MAQPSRADPPNASPTRLRLRADDRLVDRLRPDGDGFLLDIPSRRAVSIDDGVRVELGLGPLADEVELHGRVVAVLEAEAHVRLVRVRLDEHAVLRARYVLAVLEGQRSAAPRSHRRIPCDLTCRWTQGLLEHHGRVGDLSRGGAFVVSRSCPDVGTQVTLELDDADLRLPGQVTWTRRDGGATGFGVSFKIRERAVADRLFRIVRAQEQSAPHGPDATS
jgi:hypothetical protein